MYKTHKRKFYCKGTSSVLKFDWENDDTKINWEERFKKGKWYDGECDIFEDQQGYNRYRAFRVYDEMNKLTQIPLGQMRCIFELEVVKLRNIILNELLNEERKKEE